MAARPSTRQRHVGESEEIVYRKKFDPVVNTHNKYRQELDGEKPLMASVLGGKFFKEDNKGPSREAVRYAQNQTKDHDKRRNKDPVYHALRSNFRQTMDRDGSGRTEISAIVAGAGTHQRSAAPKPRKDFIKANRLAARRGGQGGASPRHRPQTTSSLGQSWGARRTGRELFPGGPAQPRSITPNREIAQVVRMVRATKRPQTAGVPSQLKRTKEQHMAQTLPRGPGEGRLARPSENHKQFLKLAQQSFGEIPDLATLRAQGPQTARV